MNIVPFVATTGENTGKSAPMIGKPFFIVADPPNVQISNAIVPPEAHLDQNAIPLFPEPDLDQNVIPLFPEPDLDQVDWAQISNTIPLFREPNLDQVDWTQFLDGIQIQVDWTQLSMNHFCSLDYQKMLLNMKDFCEELVEVVFHPKRIQRICDTYQLDMTDYIELV
jgi:hypothetical protein